MDHVDTETSLVSLQTSSTQASLSSPHLVNKQKENYNYNLFVSTSVEKEKYNEVQSFT